MEEVFVQSARSALLREQVQIAVWTKILQLLTRAVLRYQDSLAFGEEGRCLAVTDTACQESRGAASPRSEAKDEDLSKRDRCVIV